MEEKCRFPDCPSTPTGGYQLLLDASTDEDPNATILGGVIRWCEAHKSSLHRHTVGKRGYLINPTKGFKD